MERDKQYDNIQCPVCGFYCLGSGGRGCIDKPFLAGLQMIKEKQGETKRRNPKPDQEAECTGDKR